MQPKILTSLDNPRVKEVVRLREHRERRRSGLFVAEGSRAVQRGIEARLKLVSLFYVPEQLKLSPQQAAPALGSGAAAGAAWFEVTPALMKRMAYCENPEGILAVFEQPAWQAQQIAKQPDELWLVAVSTAKPGNLGAMARSAEAAGATGMLVTDEVVDAFNPNAIRASTGAVLTLPILAMETGEAIAFLQARQVRVIAASPDAKVDYSKVDLARSVALVIGPEDVGLDERWREAAQQGGELVSIPMRGRVVDSLNASNAAAVLLFEAVRQRNVG